MLEDAAEDASAEQDEKHEPTMGHGGGGHQDCGDHDGHGGMHEGHEQMFRRRFFVSTVLSIPVLLYSETLQSWLGFSVPSFPGSEWINPVFAVIVFVYGGLPFLRMAVSEVEDRSPRIRNRRDKRPLLRRVDLSIPALSDVDPTPGVEA